MTKIQMSGVSSYPICNNTYTWDGSFYRNDSSPYDPPYVSCCMPDWYVTVGGGDYLYKTSGFGSVIGNYTEGTVVKIE
jgi:hypothetical protein